MLTWNLLGPANMPGQIFVAAMGTAAAFSAGLAVGYTGLILSNPSTPIGQVPKRVIPLRLTFIPTVLAGSVVALGIVKATGTCTADTFSGFSGIITSKGIKGTATGVCVVAGTASFTNGTAGPSVHGPNWVQMLGSVTSQVGAASNTVIPGASCLYDLQSEEGIMPGECIAICPSAAVTALASIAWVEVPLNSGA
jgi:hypothetical protein